MYTKLLETQKSESLDPRDQEASVSEVPKHPFII